MRIAIMQPYFFPYLGYFQLIHAAHVFVCLDDVAFIKKGWIHRNRLCFNGEPYWFTVPLHQASQFQTIRDTQISMPHFCRWKRKLLASFVAFYGKMPYFLEGMTLIETVLESPPHSIAELATSSLRGCCTLLGIDTPMVDASLTYHNASLKKESRLIDICQTSGADTYINAEGGVSLYSHSMFAPHNIRLKFIQPSHMSYDRHGKPFISNLSILDAIMCCGAQTIRERHLNKYDIMEAA